MQTAINPFFSLSPRRLTPPFRNFVPLSPFRGEIYPQEKAFYVYFILSVLRYCFLSFWMQKDSIAFCIALL